MQNASNGWLPVDRELLDRLTRPDREGWATRLELAACHATDPLRAPKVLRYGDCTACLAPATPGHSYFNMVYALSAEQLPHLDELLAMYDEYSIKPAVQVMPGYADEAVGRALVERGLAPRSWIGLLYRPIEPLPTGNGLLVRQVDAHTVEDFELALLEGFEIPETGFDDLRSAICDWTDVGWWRLYVAEVEGQPAAAAVLALSDKVGYLAMACTRPGYRNLGCQHALIARRMRDAAEVECELLAVQTRFGSQSQRNQERLGFRLAATMQVWGKAAD